MKKAELANPRKIHKTDVAQVIAKELDVSVRTASKMIDAYHGTIVGALSNGDAVSFIGFGKFFPRYKDGRPVRNPQTGEEIMMEPYVQVVFSPGDALKRQVKKAHRES